MTAQPVVITATPTLFDADEHVDLDQTRRHFTWLDRSGIDIVFPAGTSGEFPTLSDDERMQLLDVALEVFGADRVILHVGAPSAYQATRLAKRAIERGATRLSAITPYFQPAPVDAVRDYYARIVDAADGASVLAYIFEARTTTESEPSLLAELAQRGVSGVKISGEDDASVDAYLAARPDGFTVLSGNDVSFARLVAAGGDGVVSGISSAFPEPFVALRDALRAGDQAAVAAAQADAERAASAVLSGGLAHLKAGIAARGFAASPVRSAVAPVSAEKAAEIESVAASCGGVAEVEV